MDQSIQNIIRALQTSKNGFIYGSRLRFAHSIVISFLFRPNQPLNKRLRQVMINTLKHGELLLLYAMIYKSLLLNFLQNKKISSKNGLSEFLSGLIGGLIIYSGLLKRYDNNISHQITLYCGSRVMLGLGKKLAQHLAKSSPSPIAKQHKIENVSWAIYASLTWATVMYLYKADYQLLQKSLTYSMDYIYNNDNSRQLSNIYKYLKKRSLG